MTYAFKKPKPRGHSQAHIYHAFHSAILEWYKTRPGGTALECAHALGMSPNTVWTHVRDIKKEWRARDRQQQLEKLNEPQDRNSLMLPSPGPAPGSGS